MGEELAVTNAEVMILKGNQEPPVGKLYYGLPLTNGLTPVMMRRARQAGKNKKIFDRVVWYEKKIMQEDGLVVPLKAHVVVAPERKELDPNALYPVAIFNISRIRFDGLMRIKRWKTFAFLDDSGMPYMVPSGILKPFAFVIVNNNYIPNDLPNGNTDDGNWQIGAPVTGTYIINFFDNLEEKSKPLSYDTRVVIPQKAKVEE